MSLQRRMNRHWDKVSGSRSRKQAPGFWGKHYISRIVTYRVNNRNGERTPVRERLLHATKGWRTRSMS